MKAALVTEYGWHPRYADVPEATATHGDEAVVEVLAAALSPRVRSQARGSHYTSTDELPLIPGIDGVGRLANGKLVYFLLPDTNKGAMAERVAVDLRRTVSLPRRADPVAIAAVMNPAMASWVALRGRIGFRRGQRVLILGATGNAGRCAVQVARALGASDVIAAGRGAERMRDLDVGAVVDLAEGPDATREQLAAAGRAVDVVLDFLWGEPTRDALHAIIPARQHDEQQLTWIQIGAIAGPDCAVPAAALRAVNLRIVGSGQGSVSPRAYRKEVEVLAREIHKGTFTVPARPVPLSDVEEAWVAPSRERLVLVP